MFVTVFKYLSLNRCISGPSHHILAQQIVLITLFKKSCQPKMASWPDNLSLILYSLSPLRLIKYYTVILIAAHIVHKKNKKCWRPAAENVEPVFESLHWSSLFDDLFDNDNMKTVDMRCGGLVVIVPATTGRSARPGFESRPGGPHVHRQVWLPSEGRQIVLWIL